jgi:hypothetical protein
MLFGSTLLEVAIGVVFVYLLVSLLCSALNELIEALLKYRARYLKKGIAQLLSDPGLARQFFDHPLVKPLGDKPSYISSRTFSLSLWNIATTEAAKAQKAAGTAQQVVAGVTPDVTVIRNLLAGLDDTAFKDLKVSLITLIDEAETGVRNKALVLDAARKNVENWYDDAMDRVSGRYKRRVNFILIVMGLLAAFALNIDTIQITKALLYNDTLRKAVADSAEEYVKSHPTPTPTPAATATPTPPPTSTPTNNTTPPNNTTPGGATGTASVAPTPTPDPQLAAEAQARLAKAKIDQVRGELNSLGLPIGWPTKPAPVPDKMPPITDEPYKGIADETERKAQYDTDVANHPAALAQYKADLTAYNKDPRWPSPAGGGWWLKILGIVLTGLAVSQGAPFWFDLLNKIIVIRSTVKPKEKSKDEGSKDKTDDDKKNDDK